MERGFLEIIHIYISFILCVCGLYLARVLLFVLHHTGHKNCCTDPGLSHVVAQFRHTEDARLHQTPAGQTEKISKIFICFLLVPVLLLALSYREYWLMVMVTNLSFSDSSSFLTVE